MQQFFMGFLFDSLKRGLSHPVVPARPWPLPLPGSGKARVRGGLPGIPSPNGGASPAPIARLSGHASIRWIVGFLLLLVGASAGFWWGANYQQASISATTESAATSASASAAKPDGAAKPEEVTKPGGAQQPEASSKRGGRGPRGGGDSKPTLVSARPIEQADIPDTLDAVGTATALNTAQVRARVEGVLLSIAFREGERVAAGDVLAQIDPAPFEVAVRSAEGVLARDRALLQNAELDLKRFEDLWQKESIARQQLDTQNALVQQLRGTVQVSQAALDTARLNLSYTRIKAPIAGRLGLRQVDIGNVVRASDVNGLVSITQDDPLGVVFAVPDRHIARLQTALRSGKPPALEALDRSSGQRLAQGKLGSMDNAIDPATGTVRLKGVLSNGQLSLYPNQSVLIRMVLGQRKGVLLAPASAVQRGADGTFVYVVDEGQTVALRKVQTGVSAVDRVEVTGDIQAGEWVVTEGTDRLRPGASVEVAAARRKREGDSGSRR